MLVVVSGLPGTGKSSVAAQVSTRLGAVHLSVDQVEDAMLGAGLARGWTTGVAAYEAVRAAAEQNLAIGHSVVVDAVNDSDAARQTWRNASAATGAPLLFVVLRPPDEYEHRRRLETRVRPLRHVPEPTWEQVAERASEYEPWHGDRVEVDAAEPLDGVVLEVLGAIRARERE